VATGAVDRDIVPAANEGRSAHPVCLKSIWPRIRGSGYAIELGCPSLKSELYGRPNSCSDPPKCELGLAKDLERACRALLGHISRMAPALEGQGASTTDPVRLSGRG